MVPLSLPPPTHILLRANFDLQVNGTGFVLDPGCSDPCRGATPATALPDATCRWGRRPGPLAACCSCASWKDFLRPCQLLCRCYLPSRLPLHCSLAFTPRAQESFPVFSVTLGGPSRSHWVPNIEHSPLIRLPSSGLHWVFMFSEQLPLFPWCQGPGAACQAMVSPDE